MFCNPDIPWIFYCIFFQDHLVPLYPLHPAITNCCPFPWPLFYFCLILPPSNLPLLSCHPAIYLWVFLYFSCWFSFFIRFHIWVKLYDTCLAQAGLFHLAQCSPGPSMLLQRVNFSFLLPGSIPLYKCPIVVLATHILMGRKIYQYRQI